MSKNYYLIKSKWSVGGSGFIVLVKGDHPDIIVGRGHINKKSDLELKVENGEIVSMSEDYKYKKVDKERYERMKRKEERYKTKIL